MKEIRKNFFPSVYMKINWTFNYLRVMERIQESSERKKRKKKERKKENKNIFFHLLFFSICIYENELGESVILLTLF